MEVNRYRRGLELVHRRKRQNVETLFSSLFFRRGLSQRRVENTRVDFWTFSPVSVKKLEIGIFGSLLRLHYSNLRNNFYFFRIKIVKMAFVITTELDMSSKYMGPDE